MERSGMAILAFDVGTTFGRAWLVEDGRILSASRERGGARDVAQGRQRGWVIDLLLRLARSALKEAGAGWSSVDAAVAFGMITSELGLEEVPHLEAPVGIKDIAGALRERRLDELPVPLLLVPGVRSPNDGVGLDDVMRGEETQVTGLVSSTEARLPLVFVSTGSHTKFVFVDADSRICWSVTTLSGELIWALHRETILSKLVDPSHLLDDLSFVERGARAVQEGGLSRALFATRLLNVLSNADPSKCSDFLYGAVAEADIQCLRATVRARGLTKASVVVAKGTALAGAYTHLLSDEAWVDEITILEGALGPSGAWRLYVARETGAA
jgi:2-dehydro-3-deoxygalactonokinase